jgi:hypothetical protein
MDSRKSRYDLLAITLTVVLLVVISLPALQLVTGPDTRPSAPHGVIVTTSGIVFPGQYPGAGIVVPTPHSTWSSLYISYTYPNGTTVLVNVPLTHEPALAWQFPIPQGVPVGNHAVIVSAQYPGTGRAGSANFVIVEQID